MNVFDPDNQLPNDMRRLLLAHPVVHLNVLEQVPALDQLGHNVQVRLGLDRLLVRNQQRVVQNCHHAALMTEKSIN